MNREPRQAAPGREALFDGVPFEPKVLVADDTAASRNLLEIFLRKLGLPVLSASDGRQAVELFVAEAPDVVLMDVVMPELDGIEATRRIRELQGGRWIPIVMLSALSEERDIVAGLDAGADDYLVKPVSFAVFSAKMRSVLRQLAMQRTIVESLERLRAISDAVIDGLLTLDERSRILSCNRAACSMFGYSSQELLALELDRLLPGECPIGPAPAAPGAGAPEPGWPLGVVRRVLGRRRDDARFPLELGLGAIELPDRRLFVGVLRDVSERERIERERAQTRARFERLYAEQQREQELAREVIERQLRVGGLDDPRVQYAVLPARRFSGDLVMLARAPGGRTVAMLADATGHGLAAAVSVLPVAALFHGEVARDVALEILVERINHHLCGALPVGRFVAATLLCLEADGQAGEIWVGGMPEALLLNRNGVVQRRFCSHYLPLGVERGAAFCPRPIRFSAEYRQQIVLFSDGLVEAASRDGTPFGHAKVERVLAEAPPERRVDALLHAVQAHCGGAEPHDDVSMLVLDCAPCG